MWERELERERERERERDSRGKREMVVRERRFDERKTRLREQWGERRR
jgi:hypothetical protein